MDRDDDEAAIRFAVADILVFMRSDRVTDESLREIRVKVEEAAEIARSQGTKRKEKVNA